MFIDGDHSYDVAAADIDNYLPLVEVGGFALIDDSAYFLPGFGYSKGFESVSRACQKLETAPHLRNVLNVGKMRVFERARP